jgi:hypothetical protein
MHKGWFIFRIIGSLILLVALVLGGAALFHAGFSQGYLAASASSAAAGAAPSAPAAPVMPYGYYPRPMFFPGFFGLGLLIPALLLGLVFLAGLRFLFFRPMMMWHGYRGHQFGPFGPHGPMGGRCDPQEMEKWHQEWQKWHEQGSGAGEKTESPNKTGE